MSDVLQAVYRGDREEAELLATGRDLDVFEASALGRTERVRELLDADPSLVDAYGDDGFHPVGLASFFGHVDTARLLFERGADANQLARNEHIQTAAIHAAAAAEAKDQDTRYELGKLALEVLQVAPDQIVRRSAHRPASPPTKWSTASRNLLHS